MYPAQFEYSKAGSVAEAIQILQGDPDAKLIAGGHSLLPLMKLRLARPSRVVDIGGIAGLRGISVSDGVVSIGALTTPLRDFHVGGRAGQLRHFGRGCRGCRRPGGAEPGHHRRQRVPRGPGLRPAHGADGAGGELQPARAVGRSHGGGG